jgi:hypothetical protein
MIRNHAKSTTFSCIILLCARTACRHAPQIIDAARPESPASTTLKDQAEGQYKKLRTISAELAQSLKAPYKGSAQI